MNNFLKHMQILINKLKQQLKRNGSRKEIKFKFTTIQWLYFSQLLEKGYSLEKVIELMDCPKAILLEVESGKSIENIILMSCKGRLHILMGFFMKITGVAPAIRSSVNIFQFEKEMKKKLIKQTAYPLFILCFSFVTIFIFSTFVVPQLIQNFDVDQGFLLVVIEIIRMISLSAMILLVGIFVLCLLCKIFDKLMRLIGVQFIKRSAFCKELMSYYLSSYLIVLDACGLSTRQMFVFMLDIEKQVLFHKVVHSIYCDAVDGKELILAIRDNKYVSKNFKTHYTIGSSSNDFRESMIVYRDLQEQVWLAKIQRLGLVMQMISYSFIGILVVCVYQIMLIPLQLLERM